MSGGPRCRLLLLMALNITFAPAWGARAWAGPAEDEIAKAHFTTGTRYYQAGRFAEAAKEFVEAYELSGRPSLLYNAARAFAQTDDTGRAMRYYQRYLTEQPAAAERVEIESLLFKLSQRAGKLVVRSNVDDTDVLVDGEALGKAPLAPLPVTAGRHRVEGRRPGHGLAVVEVEVGAGLSAEAALVLLPATLVTDVRREVLPTVVSVPVPSARPRWLWPVVIGGAALVAAGVAVGVVLGGAPWDHTEARTLCDDTPGCVLVEY